MPATPATTTGGYCTPEQMLVVHDWEQVADLLRDGSAPRPQRAAVVGSTLLASLLLAAAGELEAAVLAGNRYRPADLSALTGAGAGYLQRLVADLAFWRLCQRRQPGSADPKQVPGAQQALEALDALRNGERVFAFQETHDAGLPSEVPAPDPKRRESVFRRAGRLFGEHGY